MLKKNLWFSAPLIAISCSYLHATTIPLDAPCSPKILFSDEENWNQRALTSLPKGVHGYLYRNNNKVSAFSLVYKASDQGLQSQPSIKVPNIHYSEYEVSREINGTCIYWVGIRK